MSKESLEMCGDFLECLGSEITGNSILKILRKYAAKISVFDMMNFTSQVIEENKYVQESYRVESQKSYIESFLLRINDISADTSNYSNTVDKDAFVDAINILKSQAENDDSNNKNPLIFHIASIYATFALEDPIHPVALHFQVLLRLKEKMANFIVRLKKQIVILQMPFAIFV